MLPSSSQLDPLAAAHPRRASNRWNVLPAALVLALGACSADPAPLESDTDGSGQDEGEDEDDDSSDDSTAERDAGSDDDEDQEEEPADDEPDSGKNTPPPPDGEDKCAGIREDAPAGKGNVDIVFVIDTSGSMLHAITQVQSNIVSFVDQFESSNANTRVIIVTGVDPALGSASVPDPEKYRFVPASVDSQQLYSTALSTFGQYQDFLRPNAVTQFVMVTDDNDRIAPQEFESQMRDLLGHEFTQHAIASESVGGLPCISESQLWNPLCVAPIPAVCAAIAIGEAYYALAEQTGGEQMSICLGDWSSVFEQLTTAVIEAVPLPCDYPLANASSEDFDADKVQVVYTPEGGQDDEFPRASSAEQCGDRVGWFYDDPNAPASISLCPTACELVQQGGSMDIAFGCEAIQLL